MRYCIIYALTNFHSKEKISVGLICVTSSGWSYQYSPEKVKTSESLLSRPEGAYVNAFVSGFRQHYLEGRDPASVVSTLETLRRYSNNYVIFSPVKSIDIPDSKITPEHLYQELVVGHLNTTRCRRRLRGPVRG